MFDYTESNRRIFLDERMRRTCRRMMQKLDKTDSPILYQVLINTGNHLIRLESYN